MGGSDVPSYILNKISKFFFICIKFFLSHKISFFRATRGIIDFPIQKHTIGGGGGQSQNVVHGKREAKASAALYS